jgi:hypothetical protein
MVDKGKTEGNEKKKKKKRNSPSNPPKSEILFEN